MKNNKLLESIKVLDSLERKRFRNVIKNKRRNTLLSLYELCLTRIEKELSLPKKEEVYQYLFGKKYTKANDFLLRNEYRLLTDEVEDFLRHTAIDAYLPGVAEAARLRRILESGNTTLYRKEYELLSVKYANDLLFWQIIDPVHLLYFITSDQMSVPHFATVRTKIKECKDRLGRNYNRYLSDYEVKQAYTDKVYSILSDTDLEAAIVSQTIKTDTVDDLVDYRKLKAQTYYTTGANKIKILLEAEQILTEKKIPELGIDEMWWLKASAGLEYHLQYDFKSAIACFDVLFESPGIEKFNRLPETALNYLSALMSIGDYEKAVKVITHFEHKMAASPAVFYKYICLKSLALLFLGKGAAARKELNSVEDHAVDFDFFYWRIVMILSFAVEKRWDEAQNEFKNIQKTKTVKQNTRPDLVNTILILDYLIKFGMLREMGKKIPISGLKECEDKINEMVSSPGDFLHPPRLVFNLLQELKQGT